MCLIDQLRNERVRCVQEYSEYKFSSQSTFVMDWSSCHIIPELAMDLNCAIFHVLRGIDVVWSSNSGTRGFDVRRKKKASFCNAPFSVATNRTLLGGFSCQDASPARIWRQFNELQNRWEYIPSGGHDFSFFFWCNFVSDDAFAFALPVGIDSIRGVYLYKPTIA